MADIAAGDVSYSVDLRNAEVNDAHKRIPMTIAFGDGALTYPTGGVPLTKSKMGLRSDLRELQFVDSGSANGLIYKFDKANGKIRIYQGDNDAVADGPLVELAGGSATPAAVTLSCVAIGF